MFELIFSIFHNLCRQQRRRRHPCGGNGDVAYYREWLWTEENILFECHDWNVKIMQKLCGNTQRIFLFSLSLSYACSKARALFCMQCPMCNMLINMLNVYTSEYECRVVTLLTSQKNQNYFYNLDVKNKKETLLIFVCIRATFWATIAT